jgi:hypothetical protein
MKFVTAGMLVVLLSAPVRAQQDLAADEVLARVNTSMRALWATLPEFVCTETITSIQWDKGKLQEEHRVESTLTYVRDEKSVTEIREVRETTAIDGKPAGPKTKLPKALRVRMSDDLVTPLLFSRFITPPQNTTYRLAGFEEVAGRRAIRIEFTAPPPRQRGTFRVVSTVGGSMLIDAETMRLIQIEHHSADSKLIISGEFHTVQIGDGAYWLPRAVTQEVLGPLLLDAFITSKRTSKYSAAFSGCRKFDVAVRILPH